MSIDVRVNLFIKDDGLGSMAKGVLIDNDDPTQQLKEKILSLIEKEKLGVRNNRDEDRGWDFYVAGFGFDIGLGYQEDENGEPVGDADRVILSNSTNFGWSYNGDLRDLQFPIAHTLGQVFAMQLNIETMVEDPQSGKEVYYRRTDHPEVHAVLDNNAGSFSGKDYENFVQFRKGKEGEWDYLGYAAQMRRQGKTPWGTPL